MLFVTSEVQTTRRCHRSVSSSMASVSLTLMQTPTECVPLRFEANLFYSLIRLQDCAQLREPDLRTRGGRRPVRVRGAQRRGRGSALGPAQRARTAPGAAHGQRDGAGGTPRHPPLPRRRTPHSEHRLAQGWVLASSWLKSRFALSPTSVNVWIRLSQSRKSASSWRTYAWLQLKCRRCRRYELRDYSRSVKIANHWASSVKDWFSDGSIRT